MVHLPFVGSTNMPSLRPTRSSIKSLIAFRSTKSLVAKSKNKERADFEERADYDLSDDESKDYENEYDENIGLQVAALREAFGLRYGDDSLADRQWSAVFGWVRSQQECTLRIQAAFRGELARRRLLKLKQELESTPTEVDDSSDDDCFPAQAARMPTPSEYFAGQGSLSVGSLAAEESKGGCPQAARLPTPSEYFAGQGSLSVGSLDAEESKGGDHELELSADEQAAKEAFASQRRFVHLHELRAQAEAFEEAHLGEQSFV